MKQIRLTVLHNSADPAEDLRVAAKIRRDLWAHSSVEVDPDSLFSRVSRDHDRNVYFECVAEYPEAVQEVVDKAGYTDRVRLEVIRTDVGLVCANCGYPSGFVTKCEKCGYRDIEACPLCRQEVAREQYEAVSGDLFICPACHGKVRLGFSPVLVRSGGRLAEPAVVVRPAQE
jgi:hypothetical protein